MQYIMRDTCYIIKTTGSTEPTVYSKLVNNIIVNRSVYKKKKAVAFTGCRF